MLKARRALAILFLVVGLALLVYNGLGYDVRRVGRAARIVWPEPERFNITVGVVLLVLGGFLYPRGQRG